MIEECARHRCIGDEGSSLTVIEYRHIFTISAGNGPRRQPGAAWLTLTDGEPVRYIDSRWFEVIGSGEMIRREGEEQSPTRGEVGSP